MSHSGYKAAVFNQPIHRTVQWNTRRALPDRRRFCHQRTPVSGARPVLDEQEVAASLGRSTRRISCSARSTSAMLHSVHVVITLSTLPFSNGLTKSPASTWPNRAKNRSSTCFAVNSARSLISAGLAQSPNAASSTLCYLLRAFRHRSRESAHTLQTGRPARHAARRVLVNRARSWRSRPSASPPGAGTGGHGEALSHPQAGTSLSARACPYRHLEVITEWPNIMPAPHATREPSLIRVRRMKGGDRLPLAPGARQGKLRRDTPAAFHQLHARPCLAPASRLCGREPGEVGAWKADHAAAMKPRFQRRFSWLDRIEKLRS